MNAIATKKLRLAYDGHRVVDCLDLMIPLGKVTSLIGPNGCGKSTILKAAGRILKPQKGWVLLNGSDIQALPTSPLRQQV